MELANTAAPSFPKRRVVIFAYNEQGRRIGELHHNARISDEMVDRIREMKEDLGYGYLRICKELNLALTTVRKICTYQRRADTPARYVRRKIEISGARTEPTVELSEYVWKNGKTYLTYRVKQ
jgi:hypothetical protein